MHASYRKTRVFVALFALAASAAVSPIAQADATPGPTQDRYDNVVVHFGDLDLSNPAGIQVLHARLENAAERACGKAPSTRDLERKAQYRACVDSTLASAIDKVGARNLYASQRTAFKCEAG